MKKLSIGLFSLLLSSGAIWAQGNKGLTGVVTDGKQPIAGATISLLNAKDSSVTKTVVSDAMGQFQITGLPTGNWLLKATGTDFQTHWQTVHSAGAVLQIQLTPVAKSLNGVVITGKKLAFEQKADKMVVNVDASPSNAGATALEVLEKTPGITLDREGNISLKGKQGVMVMMDGRPTYLSPTELANYLRTLPASTLETIEIMTNPPAKYDAAGNAGVINIKTKKNKANGFSGNVNANYGQGQYWRNNIGGALNYRKNKWNLFTNLTYSNWTGFNDLEIRREFTNPSTQKVDNIFTQNSLMINSNKNNINAKLGADYQLNKKTTVGLVLTGFRNPENNRSDNKSQLRDGSAIVDSTVWSRSTMEDLWKNIGVNLNLRKTIDTTGREYSMDADYVGYNSYNQQKFISETFDPSNQLLSTTRLNSYFPIHINIYSYKFDYTHPINKQAKLEMGVKTSVVNTDNAANFYQVTNNIESPDWSKTNNFIYEENINAAYVNWNQQITAKWSVQAGLRLENTNAKGNQLGNSVQPDSSFKRNYTNLFPTLYATYAASDKHQFTINYGRRIDRPAYQDLNPFLFFLDQYTYNAGNPFLRPQFTDNIELSHTFKQFLTTTVNYSYTKDLFMETFEQVGLASVVRTNNIGQRQNIGAAVSAQVPVAKWWSANIYLNYNYSKFKGPLYGEMIDMAAGNFLVNITNQHKFKKGWSAEWGGFYRTKGIEGQIVIQPLGQLNVGGAKQIWNNKATLKLNVRDVLWTNYPKGEIQFQQTLAAFRNRRDSRVATISFVYRFGKQQGGNNRRRSGADDEAGRVKSGGNN